MKRLHFTIILLLVFCSAKSQKLDVEFRTVAEPGMRYHELKFLRGGKCTLKFPAKNHGDAMFRGTRRPIELQYKSVNDTITLHGGLDIMSDTNRIVQRILNARFINKAGDVYDCKSGYTYVDRKSISSKHSIWVIDGKVIRQKNTKVDGYGQVKRTYRQNPKLKRKLKNMNTDEYHLRMLSGKEAYLKYGKVGMNGVFEITRKSAGS